MEIKKVIVDNETVCLKKNKFLGWKVVHPIKNDDGSINYFNLIFGSKSNLIFLIVVLIIAAMLFVGIDQMMQSCKNMAAHPCDYFGDLICNKKTW